MNNNEQIEYLGSSAQLRYINVKSFVRSFLYYLVVNQLQHLYHGQ